MLFLTASCQQDAVVCTAEWVTFEVYVKDSLENPVILDDYYTQNEATGELIRFREIYGYNDSLLKIQGCYLLITDGQGKWAKNGFFEIIFKGFIDSVEVISEKYIVVADVCHINLLKGNTKIIVE
jgi:hypothetical protein